MVALTSYPRVGLSSDDRSAGRYLCPRYRRCQWHRRCLRSTYGARWRAIVVGGRTYYSQTFFEKNRGEAVSPKILRRKGEVLAGRISNAGTAGWPKFWHWSDQNCPSLKRINQNLFQLLRCTPQRVKTSGSGLSKCPGVISAAPL
jgi:hypothetical protein